MYEMMSELLICGSELSSNRMRSGVPVTARLIVTSAAFGSPVDGTTYCVWMFMRSRCGGPLNVSSPSLTVNRRPNSAT